MSYKSKRPTKERKQMYNFMERNKVNGTVSTVKLGKYIIQKGYKVKAGRSNIKGKIFGIYTKTGTEILRGSINIKTKRVKMWYVL